MNPKAFLISFVSYSQADLASWQRTFNAVGATSSIVAADKVSVKFLLTNQCLNRVKWA